MESFQQQFGGQLKLSDDDDIVAAADNIRELKSKVLNEHDDGAAGENEYLLVLPDDGGNRLFNLNNFSTNWHIPTRLPSLIEEK